ncbi:C40 family peptidase [Caldichromatium japonicum]|nr:C40 family peptidase [Caldichromatium japonicum]
MKARGWYLLFLVLVIGVLMSMLSGCASRGGLTAKRADLVAKGLAQIGTPYVYGGTSPRQGFDCSGLTYYAHYQTGLRIPRTAAAQHRAARPVSRNRLQPGDMVFFKTGPDIYHVGLMIDRKHFVHASSARNEVRVDSLDSPYWSAHYIGAGTYLY